MTELQRATYRQEARDRPGDDLLRPLVLVAIGVLLLNDHLLKSAAPGQLTGKLSDMAGLFATPFVIRAFTEITLTRRRTWSGHSLRVLVAAAIVVGSGFAAVKLVPAATAAFGLTLAWAQQLPMIVTALWAPETRSALTQLSPAGPAPVVRDASDLLMLPALAVALLVGGAGGWVARMGAGTMARIRGRRPAGLASMLVSCAFVMAVTLAACIGHGHGTPSSDAVSGTAPAAVSQEDAVGAVIDWVVGQGELPAVVYVEEAVHEDLLGFTADLGVGGDEIARAGQPAFGTALTAESEAQARKLLEPGHEVRFAPTADSAGSSDEGGEAACQRYGANGAVLKLSAPRPLSVDSGDGFLVAVALDRGCEGSGWLLELGWDGPTLTVTRLINGFAWIA